MPLPLKATSKDTSPPPAALGCLSLYRLPLASRLLLSNSTVAAQALMAAAPTPAGADGLVPLTHARFEQSTAAFFTFCSPCNLYCRVPLLWELHLPLSASASFAPIVVVTTAAHVHQVEALQSLTCTAGTAGKSSRSPRFLTQHGSSAGFELCLHELLQLRVCRGGQGIV